MMPYVDRVYSKRHHTGDTVYEATFLKAFQTALSMRLVMALIWTPGPSSTWQGTQ